MAGNSIKIRGIAPPGLEGQPEGIRKAYWELVVEIALRVKDRSLAKGLDKDGESLRPIGEATRKHRRSEMTPTGKGDPNAPPLMPAYELSRTRSLLAGRALSTHAELYWRFDAHTGASWGEVLKAHAERGRDVIGISPEDLRKIKAQAWERWGRRQARPAVRQTVQAIVSQPELVSTSPLRGRMAEEWVDYWRQTSPTPVKIPGRPRAAYPRILAHVWGGGKPPRAGGKIAVKPPRPKPLIPKLPGPPPVPARPAYAFTALPNLEASAERVIRDTIESLPAKVHEVLARSGVKFVAGEKMADWDPVLVTQQPRGWPQGMTWANADGLYSRANKAILTLRTYLGWGGQTKVSTRMPGVLRHETGHAFDAAIRASVHADFVRAYNEDVAALSGQQMLEHAYLLQAGDAGREEAFAEVFGWLYSGGASPFDAVAAFPRVAALVREWAARGGIP